ncbi:hypothetical protein Scep_012453 [Stephania cephalantha]|uniref:Cytochrome P450 n=1 Tax=Stephania cephalantha TaxID=152367 RepID=A0AAP0P9J6_9MAGN
MSRWRTITTYFSMFLMNQQKLRIRTVGPKVKLPPGPWKLPLIGSLHHLKGTPHHTLRNLAKKHGPIMHLQLGEITTVVISSAEFAQEVLKTHDLLFLDRPQFLSIKVATYDCKNMAFAPYGDYWRELRKICTMQLLSSKRVKSFQSLREEEVSKLIRKISTKAGSPFNVSESVLSATNDVTSSAAFGKKCKDKEKFLAATHEMVQQGSGGFQVFDLFPSLEVLSEITGVKPKFEKLHRIHDAVLDDIIREHIQNKEKLVNERSVEFEEDLVDVLLSLQEGTELATPITKENIKAVILDIFVAGTETSSATVEWSMAEMMRNQQVLKKAQTEVRSALQGNTTFNEADIQELTYLKSVIKETLRLHPPLPLSVPRKCRETCEIGGYAISKGTQVIINAWAIGRDPEIWTDSESFVPERFDGISADFNGNNFGFIPFGAGRRRCPGILFGVTNIELMLAHLLYHFDWELPYGVKPEELDMKESFGNTVRRQNDLYLVPAPYSPPLKK